MSTEFCSCLYNAWGFAAPEPSRYDLGWVELTSDGRMHALDGKKLFIAANVPTPDWGSLKKEAVARENQLRTDPLPREKPRPEMSAAEIAKVDKLYLKIFHADRKKQKPCKPKRRSHNAQEDPNTVEMIPGGLSALGRDWFVKLGLLFPPFHRICGPLEKAKYSPLDQDVWKTLLKRRKEYQHDPRWAPVMFDNQPDGLFVVAERIGYRERLADYQKQIEVFPGKVPHWCGFNFAIFPEYTPREIHVQYTAGPATMCLRSGKERVMWLGIKDE